MDVPMQTQFFSDVCIVGTGRVGLPLGLSLIEAGVGAVGFDVSEQLRTVINAGAMPFHEPGYDALIASRKFQVEATPAVAAECSAIIVTVGTPLHSHIETDLSQIQTVLEDLQPHLRPGQLLCLRSTVAPGTTEFVRKWVERNTDFVVGGNFFLACCPERLAEGNAYQEVRSLPQIIGTEDEVSRARADSLFGLLTDEVLHTNFVTAELVKLFNNILRYVHFALANNFAMIADNFGANIYEARRLANQHYPRSFLAAPGLTAGTCLRKDFGMINEWNPYPDLFLTAWKLNEYVPNFLVENLSQRVELHDKVVAILGLSFKADTDDVRDSLAPKLWRYVHRQLPTEIRVSDHNLSDPLPEISISSTRNWAVDDAIAGAEVVFVATNHTGYREALQKLAVQSPDAWVADIWNVGGIDQVFYRAGQLQEPHEPEAVDGLAAASVDTERVMTR